MSIPLYGVRTDGPPQRILFGGGVMTGGDLLPWVRNAAGRYLNGYLALLHDSGCWKVIFARPVSATKQGLCSSQQRPVF